MADATPHTLRGLPRDLALFLAFVAFFTAVMLAPPVATLVQHHTLHGFVQMIPLPTGEDLNYLQTRFQYLHTDAFFAPGPSTFNYPAPCIFFYVLFLPLNHGPHKHVFGMAVCLGVFLLLLAIGVILFARALQRAGLQRLWAYVFAAGTATFSWPIIFAMQRVNIELFLWLGLAAAIYLYAQNRWYAAGVLLGFVAAFKLYPALAFALFLRPKKFGPIVAGLVTMVAVTVGSLKFIGPTIAAARGGMASGMGDFVQGHSLRFYRDIAWFDHSFFEFIKVTMVQGDFADVSWLHIYMVTAGVVMTVLFFARVLWMPRLNQLLVLIVSMLALPPTSYDYTLEALYIPLAWMSVLIVETAVRGRRLPGMPAAMAAMAILCAPENFLMLHGVRYAGQVKALTLLALLIVTVAYPFRPALQNDPLEVAHEA